MRRILLALIALGAISGCSPSPTALEDCDPDVPPEECEVVDGGTVTTGS